MNIDVSRLEEIAWEISDMSSYNKEIKNALGGLIYQIEAKRILENGIKFESANYPSRQRFLVGTCIFSDSGKVIGYQESTIMNNANPTEYEREYIELEDKLNYVQGKKVLVHPMYLGKGLGRELVQMQLNIAHRLNKQFCTDVKTDNIPIINLLESEGLIKDRLWKTQNGTRMYRMTLM